MSDVLPSFSGVEQGEDDEKRGLSKGPNCPLCERPYHEHDKEKVRHENGMWSYDYNCP